MSPRYNYGLFCNPLSTEISQRIGIAALGSSNEALADAADYSGNKVVRFQWLLDDAKGSSGYSGSFSDTPTIRCARQYSRSRAVADRDSRAEGITGRGKETLSKIEARTSPNRAPPELPPLAIPAPSGLERTRVRGGPNSADFSLWPIECCKFGTLSEIAHPLAKSNLGASLQARAMAAGRQSRGQCPPGGGRRRPYGASAPSAAESREFQGALDQSHGGRPLTPYGSRAVLNARLRRAAPKPRQTRAGRPPGPRCGVEINLAAPASPLSPPPVRNLNHEHRRD
jgi:hypothetical protein